MGLFSRAVANHSHRRAAEKFAATVKPGDTIYSTETHNMPWGGEQQLVHEYKVDRRGKVGHLTPAGLWLQAGNVSKSRPHGLQTVDEYTASEVAGPNAADAIEQPRRGILGGRRAA